jgi:phytoene dehydrogenase-like protein
MKLTSDSVLRDVYDVIVVGAGLGGLTAASRISVHGF